MTNPLVTIVICTHNRADLLRRALLSAINQTYTNIEIIVSDDASVDDTEKLVESYIEQFNKVKIIYRRNKVNSGACYTRNEAFKIAKGKYIAGLDDDDEFTPDRLEYLLSIYQDKYAFVTSNTKVISQNKNKNLFSSEREISLNDILWENVVGTQVLVKKSRLLKLGGFDVSLKSSQDADMWTRLIESYGNAYRGNSITYVLHTEHDKERISTSNSKLEGMTKFLELHKLKMTKQQISYRIMKIEMYKRNRKVGFYLLKYLRFSLVSYIIRRQFQM